MSLDKEFLETSLGEPISDFIVSPGAKLGDNVAGSLKCVKITTVSGKTLNAVYKGLTDNPEGRGFAQRFGIFRTENTTYQTIIPRVQSILKTRGIDKTDLPVPKFLSGSYDGTHDYLLLEDVRPEGYIMPDKFKGLNLSEVTLVMKEIARFHASTYFWIKYEGERIFDENMALSAVRDPPGLAENEIGKYHTNLLFTNEVKNSIQILKSHHHSDWAEKVQNILDSDPNIVYQLMGQNRKLTDTEVFPCIVHGDLWLNNIMIKYDPSGNAVDLKFLDFQMSRRGNIFEDLGYFFLCSTTPNFRDEHFPQVLNVYYDAFVSTLDQLRCPIPIGFTRGSLINNFYKGLLPSYIYMSFAIPLQLAEPLDFEAIAKAAAQQGESDTQGQVSLVSGSPGTEGNASKKALSPEEAMVKNFEMRTKMLLMQMMKSPQAVDRLVDLTGEMVKLKVI